MCAFGSKQRWKYRYVSDLKFATVYTISDPAIAHINQNHHLIQPNDEYRSPWRSSRVSPGDVVKPSNRTSQPITKLNINQITEFSTNQVRHQVSRDGGKPLQRNQSPNQTNQASKTITQSAYRMKQWGQRWKEQTYEPMNACVCIHPILLSDWLNECMPMRIHLTIYFSIK